MKLRVLVQVSEATHADWKRVASERGVSMSELARDLIEREVVPGSREKLVASGGLVAPGRAARAKPADVAATVPGVAIVRPHMKKHRPAVECPTRWPSGVCPDCGQTV